MGTTDFTLNPDKWVFTPWWSTGVRRAKCRRCCACAGPNRSCPGRRKRRLRSSRCTRSRVWRRHESRQADHAGFTVDSATRALPSACSATSRRLRRSVRARRRAAGRTALSAPVARFRSTRAGIAERCGGTDAAACWHLTTSSADEASSCRDRSATFASRRRLLCCAVIGSCRCVAL